MKHVRKIDENGFFIVDVIIEEWNTVPSDCIEAICPNGFYKPRWNGTEWIEGATQEEIEKIKNSDISQELGMNEFMLDVDYRISKLELGV